MIKWINTTIKNIRNRLFRKVDRQKSEDRDEMEEEVRDLFLADYEAIYVKWEVIYDDDQEIEVNKQIEKICLEHTDLFGGDLGQSDEE